jgi:hypothetical protein
MLMIIALSKQIKALSIGHRHFVTKREKRGKGRVNGSIKKRKRRGEALALAPGQGVIGLAARSKDTSFDHN